MNTRKRPIDSYRLEQDGRYLLVIHNMTNQPIPKTTQVIVDQGLDHLKIVVHAWKNPPQPNKEGDNPIAVQYIFEGELNELILTYFEEDV